MKAEFDIIFYRFPCVISEDFLDALDADVKWEETTQESWYDYCASYLGMSV